MKQEGSLRRGVFALYLSPEGSSLEIGGFSMLNASDAARPSSAQQNRTQVNPSTPQVKWFTNLFYAQEWQLEMTAY